MNQIPEMDDDLQPEYDFTQLTVVDRGEGRNKSNITPSEWNKIAATNPSFAFLYDSEEDIYTLEDGISVSYKE
jgi:hypothetical protein